MASIKPRRRGESSFKELDAEMQRSFSMKMGQLKRLKQDVHEEDPDSGVVFISHIPHGFYEPQMKKFFAQFGNVKRLRLSRSKKSGRSKGYAYIEFEFSEVAKVVAETMHNYLMYQKLLKCFYVPKEKLHPDTFRGCFRHFKRPRRREIASARNNNFMESGKPHILERQKRRVKNLKKKQDKLTKMGLDFKIEGLETEMTRLKESNPPAAKVTTSKKPTAITKATGKATGTKRPGKSPQRRKRGGKSQKKTDDAVAKPVTKSAGKKKVSESTEEGGSKPAVRAEKTKKVAAAGRPKKPSAAVLAAAATKRQSLRGKREVKSAKVVPKTRSRKDVGGTAKKAKRLSL